jgi:hypothetical protein
MQCPFCASGYRESRERVGLGGGLCLKIRVLFSVEPCRKNSTLTACVFRLQVTSQFVCLTYSG